MALPQTARSNDPVGADDGGMPRPIATLALAHQLGNMLALAIVCLFGGVVLNELVGVEPKTPELSFNGGYFVFVVSEDDKLPHEMGSG